MLGKRGDVQVGGEMDAYMQAVFRRHFFGRGAAIPI